MQLAASFDSPICPAPARRAARGFTIVEILAVLGIIAVILAIGVPAFNVMTTQNRITAAEQTLSGVISRAYVSAISERSMIAVRFVRADWVLDSRNQPLATEDRQAILIYRWSGGVLDPASGTALSFTERFQLLEGTTPQVLPQFTWVAPIEALEVVGGGGPSAAAAGVLAGTLGSFDLDASRANSPLMETEDFLLVFGPTGSIVPQARPYPIRLSDYTNWPAAAPVEAVGLRYAVTGLALYERGPLTAAGRTASVQDRQTVLRRDAKPYYVTRSGGQLVSGTP